MQRFFFFILLFFAFHSLHAYRIQGRIVDEQERPLPFVNLFEQGSNNGTISNEQGQFQLELSNQPVIIEFRYLGYQRVLQTILAADSGKFLVIRMLPINQLLQEAVVDGNRNEANELMQKVISNRKNWNTESKDYSCEVYLKGLQQAESLPDKIMGVKVDKEEMGLDSNGSGILYLFESLNNLEFRAPKTYNESIRSSKVSGKNNAFSYLRASDLILNFNESIVPCFDLERGFISPIGNNALFYYSYQLEGSYYEGEDKYYRIRFKPKRSTDPAGTGLLIVRDSLWYTQSIHLTLYRKNQLTVLDSLVIHTEYQVLNEHYVPVSQQLQFGLNIYGIGANGYFITKYLKYNFGNLPKKKRAKTELLVIEDSANQRSPEYWEKIRPLPLNSIELNDYQIKDSLELIRENNEIKSQRSNFGVNWIYRTAIYRNRSKGFRFESRSLIKSVFYNTVEGMVLEPEFKFIKNRKGSRVVLAMMEGKLRYGFSNTRLQGSLGGEYRFSKPFPFTAFAEAGYVNTPFGGELMMNETMNSLNTLFIGYNYLKFYQRTWINSGVKWRVFNGGTLTGGLALEERQTMQNSNEFNFRKKTGRISSNNLNDFYPDFALFPNHRVALLDIGFRLVPFNRYYRNQERIFNLGSNWPVFELSYKQSLNGLYATEPRFKRIKLRVDWSLNLKLLGKLDLASEIGTFFDRKQVYFPDYFIPGSNQGFYQNASNRALRLQTIQPYHPATTSTFWHIHAQHNFNRFLLNKLPLIKKLRANEFIGFQLYQINGSLPITEFSVGLERLALFKKDLGLLRIEGIHGRGSGLNNYVLRFGFLF